jgi:hypothetical protein
MKKLLWCLAVGGACLGAVTLIIGVQNANGAPQEAAAGAIAAALAVVPYCLARSVSELSQ